MVPWNPLNARIPAEVCPLVLHERCRRRDRIIAGIRQIESLFDDREEFTVADGLSRSSSERWSETCNLIDKARVQHRIEPLLDSVPYLGSRINTDRRERSQGLISTHGLCLG